MNERTDSNRFFTMAAAIMSLIFVLAAHNLISAQTTNYKAGDRVEADINMSSSPENADWRQATIVEVMMWQGRISGIYVKTDDGQHFTLGSKHLRPLRASAKPPAENQNASRSKSSLPAAPAKSLNGEQSQAFKVGDRVEVDSIMASDPRDSTWKKATVKAVDLKNGRYVVMLDDFNTMSVLIRPDKVWIRPLNDGSIAPAFSTCEFYRDYRKASNAAPPSAELFKSVIFEWFESTNRYQDFGMIFTDFKMGKPFKNRALGNGRKDVDPAPVGAAIYPLKTKLIFCEKDVESTFRTEWTNEYSCYKSRTGEWVCKNGAPQNYRRTSFPNER